MARVEVGSWWKLGASAADLDRDTEACVKQLGAAHRPEKGDRFVTLALRSCLREAGWYPVGQ
jgi:hypothetical protein